jgi:maltose alpha-D-glucosyltransferase/alpha-amylase
MDGPAVPPDVLADWIATQRWFAAKSRRVVAVATEDGLRLGAGTLWLLRIALDDGSRARYAVPLREGAALADALDDPSFCRALIGLIATGGRAPGAGGELRGTPTSAFPADQAAGAAPRRLGGEQSNTSVVFGERLILKHFRRLQVGPNPEIEITQFLTERTTFRHTPRLCGSLAYHDAEGEWAVAVTQELVTDARDGWRFLLDRLAAGDGALRHRAAGRITAELHLALASDRAATSAMAPEPITPAADVTA